MQKPNSEAIAAPAWLVSNDQFNRFLETGYLIFKDQVRITFSYPHMQKDILKLLKMTNGIVQPDPQDLLESIEHNHSIVGLDLDNEIIAHQRFKLWPSITLAELRTAFVRPDYRGIGLNSFMKRIILNLIHLQHPRWEALGYCQPLSMSKNILSKLGFDEVSLDFVKGQWPIMDLDCPKSDCYLKNGYACGCQVLHLQF